MTRFDVAMVDAGAQSAWWRRASDGLTKRARAAWPRLRRTLPRDAALLLVVAIAAQHLSLAWIRTDSVFASAAVVLKGISARPGDLAAFAYAGDELPNYYRDDDWARQLARLGLTLPVSGPRKGTGFVKYLIGIPGDRIEVQGTEVYLHTRQGRLFMGRCKTRSRNGDVLMPIQPQVIAPGHVYMWAPHPDALDSRYAVMGLVPVDRIFGRAIKIW